MSPILKKTTRVALTLATLTAAGLLAAALWNAYVLAPWTRDGRVSAHVVRVAPEVSGTVSEVAVDDNQPVKRGDVLYRIDPSRFELALEQARAQAAAADETLRQRQD
ncbi:biotin/lipoyl-binding protein, partial [Achromobacter ruhlandii]